MKVLVVTMYSPEYLEIANYTWPILKQYADKQGYDTTAIVLNDYKYEYAKIEWFVKLLKSIKPDVIFYIDSDAVVTNHNVRVESFIDEQHDLFVCRDVNEINFGALIIKNTDWAMEFLDFILLNKVNYDNEQNVLNAYYTTFKNKIKVVEHPAFNSYNYELYPECPNIRHENQGNWWPGNFVLHVPALHPEKRLEVLKNAKIIR